MPFIIFTCPHCREKSPDKTPPPVEGTDSAPAPIVYADPNTISREEHPTTGDVYTMPDKSRKTHKPPDHQVGMSVVILFSPQTTKRKESLINGLGWKCILQNVRNLNT